jgi:hypothetical protein
MKRNKIKNMKTSKLFRNLSLIATTTLTALQLQAQNINLSLQVSTTNPGCYGYSNGEVVIDITGGSEPYIVNGVTVLGTQFTASNLAAGNYTFNISDDLGVSTSADVTLISPQPFNMQAIITNVSTFNGNDGAINITVPAIPLTIDWTTPNGIGLVAGQEDQSSLTAGIYNLTITEPNGCTTFKRFDVNQPVGNANNYFNPSYLPNVQGGNNGNTTSAFMVYPNPSVGHITMKAEVQTKEAYVMNDMGVVVHRCQISNEGEIEEIDLNPGTYILITTDANGVTNNERILVR